MKRTDWSFKYTASKLADAAQQKQERHQKKLDWWEEKKKEVTAKVAASGITVQDSVASSYSNTKGGFGPEIVIDSTLQRDLSECQQKIREHHTRVNEYAGWVQVLAAHPESQLDLEHDDYLYFFGE